MNESEEYTGPPIGDPPVHVHDNAPVTEALEDATEEVDELLAQVTALETLSQTRHSELLERINTCQTSLQMISESPAENPLLTQILSQLSQIQAELTNLKSLTDTMLKARAPNVSPELETPSYLAPGEVDPPEVEIPDPENPTPKPETRKRRFV